MLFYVSVLFLYFGHQSPALGNKLIQASFGISPQQTSDECS